MGEEGISLLVSLGYNHHGKPTWFGDSWIADLDGQSNV